MLKYLFLVSIVSLVRSQNDLSVSLSDDSNDDLTDQNLSNLRSLISVARNPLTQQRQQVINSNSGYGPIPVPIPVTASPSYTSIRPIPIPITARPTYTTRPIPIPVTTTKGYTSVRPLPIPVTASPGYQRSRQILIPVSDGSFRRIILPRMRVVAGMPAIQGQQVSQIRQVAMIPSNQY